MKMNSSTTTRASRKHKAILQAATAVFLQKGYDGASMDDVAATARVSKPTVYKHFTDKERLFAAVVSATTDDVNELVRLACITLEDDGDVEAHLTRLARQFLTALMQPRLLDLRRMVIANAGRFPNVGRTWYEQGFGRALTTLANSFEQLAVHKALRLDDAALAANHFVGLLLWIPVNKAMFSGDHETSEASLNRYAKAAVRAFLTGYGAR
jgi:TetR/AcrR family transcriptional repressor of mexJK operon